MTVQLEAPRRVLLGRFRFRMMLVRAVLAWWPILFLLALVVVWFFGNRRVVLGVALMVVAVEYRRRGTVAGRIRAAWWRSMWWADARAAGLVVIADPSVNATHERGGSHAIGLELAPPLRRVRCRGASRLYVVRSLPGQVFSDFERAVEPLAHRWGAQVAVAEHPTRRRTILLEVVTSDVLADPIAHPTRRR